MFVLKVGSCFETTPVYPLLTSASNVQLYIGVYYTHRLTTIMCKACRHVDSLD